MLDLSEVDVVTSFSRQTRTKPLKGSNLKKYAAQLGKVFNLIFQLFLDSRAMSRTWKNFTIIPVPKKTSLLQRNDYRPFALTPIIAKCLEKIVPKHLKFDIVDQLDSLKLAYKAPTSVE